MRSNHLHQMKTFLRRIFSQRILDMKFLDNCDLETHQVDKNDLPTTETDLDLDMTTEKNNLKNFLFSSITEKIPVVDEDVVSTISTELDILALTGGEIDRNTEGEGEEDPFSNKQKVILAWIMNLMATKIEYSPVTLIRQDMKIIMNQINPVRSWTKTTLQT